MFVILPAASSAKNRVQSLFCAIEMWTHPSQSVNANSGCHISVRIRMFGNRCKNVQWSNPMSTQGKDDKPQRCKLQSVSAVYNFTPDAEIILPLATDPHDACRKNADPALNGDPGRCALNFG
eukprot:180299-Amphidinium_carterae.1